MLGIVLARKRMCVSVLLSEETILGWGSDFLSHERASFGENYWSLSDEVRPTARSVLAPFGR